MEELIKQLLREEGLSYIKLITLVDLCSVLDDYDELPIVVNVIEINENGDVVVYDDRDIDDNGEIDPIWLVKYLDDELQEEILSGLKYTLKINK